MSRPPISLSGRYIAGLPVTIPVPVKNEDGNPLNLDGRTVAARFKAPGGSWADVTQAQQRAPGSNILDVGIDATGHAEQGNYLLAPTIDGEATELYTWCAEESVA